MTLGSKGRFTKFTRKKPGKHPQQASHRCIPDPLRSERGNKRRKEKEEETGSERVPERVSRDEWEPHSVWDTTTIPTEDGEGGEEKGISQARDEK